MVVESGAPGEGLEAEVLRRLSAFRRKLGPELGAAFDTLAVRLRLFAWEGAGSYFSPNPVGLPLVQLPQWAATYARRRGATITPATVANLVEAAAVGFLHVRAQDDWFDEEVGEPGVVMMLSDALFVRHQALLAREVPRDSTFWELFEEVWLGYGDAMLFERRVHKGERAHDAAAFRRVLARSRPLVLPPAAALFAAECARAVEALEGFVAALVSGHQLFADLLDAEKDRANGNTTHVLFRLYERIGGDHQAPALRAALYGSGGFDAVVSDALEELARAERAANALGMPEAVDFVKWRARRMTEIRVKAFEAFFSALRRVGSSAPDQSESPR